MPLGADLKPQVSLNSPKRIWIINPFDQLPNETDVPLRYWALCRTFAEQGHEVIWWSSDFSHLRKAQREACPDTDGFSVRLVETPPYTKNISFARLKNHKAFADGFYADAMAGLKAGELNAPDRIVVSLPPLGVAEAAFKIRDFINQKTDEAQQCVDGKSQVFPEPAKGDESGCPTGERGTNSRRQRSENKQPETRNQELETHNCQVIVDIMDAWPETFYQALPQPLRRTLGPILLAPMHRSAKRAYQDADKISAVGQSYLNLAAQYLKQMTGASLGTSAKPMHLCYHGTDLDRFQRSRSGNVVKPEGQKVEEPKKSKTVSNQEQGTRNKEQRRQPLKAVYLGSMGQGYDLMTIIEVAARLKAAGEFPFQINFAGDGPQRKALEARAAQLGLTSPKQTPLLGEEGCPKDGVVPDQPSHLSSSPPSPPASSARVVFHGQLGRDAVNELLLASDIALVPNRPDSLVACPYKAGEYAAARLAMLSCLKGELGVLLNQWNAGSEYNEGDAASLHAAFKKYSTDPQLLNQQSINARSMGEALFDRSETYFNLVEFILNNSNYTQD